MRVGFENVLHQSPCHGFGSPSGVWRLASGVWRLASGVWRLAWPRLAHPWLARGVSPAVAGLQRTQPPARAR